MPKDYSKNEKSKGSVDKLHQRGPENESPTELPFVRDPSVVHYAGGNPSVYDKGYSKTFGGKGK